MKRTNTAKWIESAGRWQINVQKDGVRKTFTSAKPGRTGQREANKKADEWLDIGVKTERIKVSDAWEQLLQQKKLVSDAEYKNMASFGRSHLLPAIGIKSVKAVTEQDFQKIIDYAFRHPQGNSKEPLSKKTLQNYEATASSLRIFAENRNGQRLSLRSYRFRQRLEKKERTC